MRLSSTCYFNNFLADDYQVMPERLTLEKNLLLNYKEDILSHTQLCSDGLVVFGNYSLKDFKNTPIKRIDMSNQSMGEEDITFLPMLLDNWAYSIEQLYQKFKDSDKLFIVTSEFLSSLEDPRPLLLALKKILLSSANRNRVLLIYTDQTKNEGYRKWNLETLQNFLEESGFSLTAETKEENGDVFFSLEIDSVTYRDYLEKHYIASALYDAKMLLLTTEDASFFPTGGIGTYVKNLKKINPSIAVLFCNLETPTIQHISSTFVIADFVEHLNWDNFIDGIGITELVKCLLYALPNITTIEFQDYISLGHRVVQAKKTGILPQYLNLRVFLHGNIDNIKYASQDNASMNYSLHESKLSVKESYIFKNADQCYMPSKYIGTLMEDEYGYALNNKQIIKLPFDLDLITNTEPIKIEKIDQIVFIGKYLPLKGWLDFISAIDSLHKRDALTNIKHILSISPGTPENKEIERLETIRPFKYVHFTHNKLLGYIEENKSHSLFIVPAKGENYPFVILELLLKGAFFTAYNAGGAKEVVNDKKFLETFFCDPFTKELGQKIFELISHHSYKNYNEYINTFQKRIYQRQIEINHFWFKETSKEYFKPSIFPKIDNIATELTISVPVYNTNLEYISDLIQSLHCSTIKPKEVLWINDGSTDEYVQKFKTLLSQRMSLPYRIITQKNKGLAGARNKGLSESSTEYTYFIDSDDMLLPYTLSNAWISMQTNPDQVATSGFAIYFHTILDIDDYLSQIYSGNFWKPVGHSSAKVLSLYENQYITASPLVKTKKIAEFGGWDESDKATWEDWAFYTKLAWHGYEFTLIPYLGYLYRDTPGSMSKTYNQFFGRRRLIRNLDIFSKIDANILISLIYRSHPVVESVHINKLSVSEKKVINYKRAIFKFAYIKPIVKITKKFLKTILR